MQPTQPVTPYSYPPQQPPAPKGTPWWRAAWLVGVVGLVVGVAIGAGARGSSKPKAVTTVVVTAPAVSSGPPASHTAAPVKSTTQPLGTTIRVTDGDGTADVTLTGWTQAPPSATLGEHNEWRTRALFVTVKGSFAPNPLYFTAKDAAGDTFDANPGNDAELESNTITVGERARGYVYFQIPPGQKASTIVMADGLGDTMATWGL